VAKDYINKMKIVYLVILAVLSVMVLVKINANLVIVIFIKSETPAYNVILAVLLALVLVTTTVKIVLMGIKQKFIGVIRKLVYQMDVKVMNFINK